MKQLLLDLSTGKPTLANFVPGANGELLCALRSLADKDPAERMIYLWGGEGCGKSHLLRASCLDAGEGSHYVECDEDTVFETDSDFIAADDVGNLSERGQIGLFHLFNRLREKGGVLLSSGNLPPSGMNLRPDLATRLSWGLVYQVHPLGDDEKREALKGHAAMLGFEIPVEVVNYLMHHSRRDLPALVKLVDSLDFESRQSKRPVTVPLLKEIMEKCA